MPTKTLVRLRAQTCIALALVGVFSGCRQEWEIGETDFFAWKVPLFADDIVVDTEMRFIARGQAVNEAVGKGDCSLQSDYGNPLSLAKAYICAVCSGKADIAAEVFAPKRYREHIEPEVWEKRSDPLNTGYAPHHDFWRYRFPATVHSVFDFGTVIYVAGYVMKDRLGYRDNWGLTFGNIDGTDAYRHTRLSTQFIGLIGRGSEILPPDESAIYRRAVEGMGNEVVSNELMSEDQEEGLHRIVFPSPFSGDQDVPIFFEFSGGAIVGADNYADVQEIFRRFREGYIAFRGREPQGSAHGKKILKQVLSEESWEMFNEKIGQGPEAFRFLDDHYAGEKGLCYVLDGGEVLVGLMKDEQGEFVEWDVRFHRTPDGLRIVNVTGTDPFRTILWPRYFPEFRTALHTYILSELQTETQKKEE